MAFFPADCRFSGLFFTRKERKERRQFLLSRKVSGKKAFRTFAFFAPLREIFRFHVHAPSPSERPAEGEEGLVVVGDDGDGRELPVVGGFGSLPGSLPGRRELRDGKYHSRLSAGKERLKPAIEYAMALLPGFFL